MALRYALLLVITLMGLQYTRGQLQLRISEAFYSEVAIVYYSYRPQLGIDSGGSRGGKGGASVPPFGLYLTLRSTDDELNGTPLSGNRTKKTPTMAHLRML